MSTHIRTSAIATCGTALLFLGVALAQEPSPRPADDMDVLARGPVHEAFAQPVDEDVQPGPVVGKEPPAAIEELPPDQKPEGDNVQWIPGYWQWDEDRGEFVWVSGMWRATPPGRQWVPGRYVRAGNGWQWMSGYWNSTEQPEVQVVPPPPPPVDAVPAEPPPSEDSVLVPGCWVYRDTRYVWRPSYYVPYRPGWVWVPAHYIWTPIGYVFVNGYWDYPLDQRGLLFAPICFERRAWLNPGFTYTPSYVVSTNFLPTALFVRPAWRHYYFGDYFGGRYARRGFTPWIDFRIGRHAYDPLFGYYRAAHTGRPWARDLAAVYAGRARGDLAPPPRTLVQQNTQVRNTNVTNVTVLAPLARANREGVKLTRVNTQDRALALRNVEQVREVARRRGEVEARSAAAPLRAGDPPRTLKLDLPKPAPVKAKVEPPPPPAPERAQPRRQPDRPDVILRKDSTPPSPPKHESPPPAKKDLSPPPPVKKDVPPPKNNTPPPPVKKDVPPPPPPKHDVRPPPPAVKQDVSPPPPVKKELSPPPPVKRDAPAPPPVKRDTPPPQPTIKRDSPPPSPQVKREVSPPQRHEPPPPPKKDQSPPPSVKRDAPPPASVKRDTPPPPKINTPPPPVRKEAPPPAPVINKPPPPAPVVNKPPPPPSRPAPPPKREPDPSQKK